MDIIPPATGSTKAPDFCPMPLRKQKGTMTRSDCGDWNCTNDLVVMSLASLLLLHTAIRKTAEKRTRHCAGKAFCTVSAAFLSLIISQNENVIKCYLV